ncbi:MAG: hypothetical protein NZL89_02260 [Leptospiraceae bacterium]|nr:hypothetical protein [Leptospiraceae bacterium]
MALDVAISPCPNDTFAFYGLSQNPKYQLHFFDIEELNRQLLAGKFPFAKGSFALLKKLDKKYRYLPVGAAIGLGVGPILVGRLAPHCRIAAPGENTTAYRLLLAYLQACWPGLKPHFVQMPFHAIIPAVAEQKLDAGVLIHEGRFVYAKYGLPLVADLGEWYEKATGAMIPLGAIYAQCTLPEAVVSEFTTALRDSIAVARAAYREKNDYYFTQILPFMKKHAQEQDTTTIEAHVETYVSADTEWLSPQAEQAIAVFRRLCWHGIP